MYSTIGQKLYEIINALEPTTKIAAVYNYDKKEFDAFPSVIISPSDQTENIFDTRDNESVYKFIVRVVDLNKNVSSMEARMREICDDILETLRKNQFLDNTVHRTTLSVRWGWASQDVELRVCEIVVESAVLNPTV